MSERRFNRIVIASVALGFLALVAAGVAALLTIVQNEHHTSWVNHTYRVERQVSQLRVLLERSEAARRGMLLSDDPHILTTFTGAVGGMIPTLDTLNRLTADNPRQQATIARTRVLLDREIVLLNETFALVRSGRKAEAARIFQVTRSAGIVRQTRASIETMMREEDRLLALRSAAQQKTLGQFFMILTAAGVLLVVVAIASLWVLLRYTHALALSRDALRGLNTNLEGAVRERTIDLQRANEEIQRFAYIVSHDLRSPLVNVMGFTAELDAATKPLAALLERADAEAPAIVTQEARDAVREDLPEAIGFIRSSTQKMDRLINAILRLSREGRRPITPEQLDMNAMAHGVADTLRHRVGELGAEIVVADRLPGIVSDRLAVDQILSNMTENAVKYLQPGRPGRIMLGGRIEGARALYEVTDNGRGIDPRDHERIFDLFRRSGIQDQPGEGIGLAHTRALAYRLGGTITVQSTLGEGAIFRLSLPTVFAGEQGVLQ